MKYITLLLVSIIGFQLQAKDNESNERFTIKNLEINTSEEDFGLVYYKDQVVFTSSREGTKSIVRTWDGNHMPFLSLYVADKTESNELINITSLSSKINSKYHEGPATFNKAGDYMVFTKNSPKKNKEGKVNLELFSTNLEGGAWSDASPLPYNNESFNVGHPTLSGDGKTIYFVSDMQGGKGGVDIYYAKRGEDGTWGAAINMGDKVNSSGNEMFPFIHQSGLFFFSSDGHKGLGGLDVFVTKIKKDGSCEKIKNAGTPINGIKDDFSFVLDEDSKQGYFASNREGGKGDDDLYSFAMHKSFVFGKLIQGIVKDKEGNALENAVITLKDKKGNVLESITTTADGKYEFSVDRGKNFILSGEKGKFYFKEKELSSKSKGDVISTYLELENDPGLSFYCLIVDSKTQNPVEGVVIKLTNNKTGVTESMTTSVTGDFKKSILGKKLNDRGSYTLELAKEGYLTKTATYNTVFKAENQRNLHELLDLSMDEEVKDLSELVKINPIKFDSGKHKGSHDFSGD